MIHSAPDLSSHRRTSGSIDLKRVWLRAVGTALTVGLLALPTVVLASEPAKAPVSEASIRKLVDAMRKRLELPQKVSVAIVDTNPLKASVEPVKVKKPGVAPFRLSIERAFLAQLGEDELKAVIAHELGHVWIYTHHPYLQTEQLANRIALKVTSRETLVKVYGKVWADESVAGSLPRLPEPQTAAGLGKPNPK